jgi:hypothetical protein
MAKAGDRYAISFHKLFPSKPEPAPGEFLVLGLAAGRIDNGLYRHFFYSTWQLHLTYPGIWSAFPAGWFLPFNL